MTGAFEHLAPSKVVFAPAGLEPLGAQLDALGARRLFLVCGTTVRKSEAFELTCAALGSRLVHVFDEVVPHSSLEVVDAGVARLRAAAPDAVVSLGGGSAIDTAKAIVLLHAEGGTLEDHRVRFTPPDTIVYKTFTRPMLPHVALPTTFSGAEVNAGGGIRGRDRDSKYVFSAPQLAPRVAVLAPRLALGFPPDLMAGSALNCLAHGVEALYSRHAQPIADALALGAIALIAEWLPRAVAAPGDLEARGRLLIASAMAGLALTNAKVCVHHAMCHVLGARYGIPHGFANAVMLPHAMEFNRTAAREPLARVAGAFGHPGGSEGAITAVRDLADRVSAPRRLRDLGVPREDLPALAEHAFLDRDVYYNPRRIESPAEIQAVYEAVW